jgi:hypothetical protein
MSSGIRVPSIVPSNSSTHRRPPSLGRVPQVGSPDSAVLCGRSDSLRHVPLRFVSFARRYRSCPSLRSRERPDTALSDQDFSRGALQTARASPDDAGPPRFLGGPPCTLAMLSDPVEARRSSPSWPDGFRRRIGQQRRPSRSRCFRGSIPRLARSLSTLRRASRLATTQDSLPAGR